MKLRALLLTLTLGAGSSVFGMELSPEQTAVATKLITFCRACHGVGKLKFIKSSDPAAVWQTLVTERVPGTDRLWRDAIVATLDWPTDEPPPQTAEREPGKAWMPRGGKRLELASDLTEGEPTRSLILRVLGSSF